MRVSTSAKLVGRLASRFLAGVLPALILVSLAAGQSSDDTAKPSTYALAKPTASTPAKPTSTKATGAATTSKKSGAGASRKKSASRTRKGSSTARAARTARIHQAFVASAELRPMAQQLATLRTPAAYAGVTKYAQQHTGEAAAAAYLALGHAYLLDKRYSDAESSLRDARKAGGELLDYADYLGAEASHDSGNNQAAELLLRGFGGRYPDS